jgi:uncharacterized protein YdaU (DUF1376 family)
MPLFWESFFADTDHLSDAELGLYTRLLGRLWLAPNQRLPNDDEWLARRFRLTPEQVQKCLRPIIKEFLKGDGNWVWSKRICKEHSYVEKHGRQQSDNAKARWNKEKDVCHGNAHALALALAPTLKKERAKALYKESRKPEAPPPVCDEPKGFLEWFAAYPRKVGRDSAVKAYRGALAKGDSEEILDGLRRARGAWEQAGTEARYIPHPATWLNRRGWADEDCHIGNGSSDPIGEAHQMTLAVIRKMRENGNGDFTGTYHEMSDGSSQDLWSEPEDYQGTDDTAGQPLYRSPIRLVARNP